MVHAMLDKLKLEKKVNQLIAFSLITLIYIAIKSIFFEIGMLDLIVLFPNIVLGGFVIIKFDNKYVPEFTSIFYFIVFAIEIAYIFFDEAYFYSELIAVSSLGILYFSIRTIYLSNKSKWLWIVKLAVLPATIKYIVLIFTDNFDGGFSLAELRFFVLLIPIAIFVDNKLKDNKENTQLVHSNMYLKIQAVIILIATMLSLTVFLELSNVINNITLAILLPLVYISFYVYSYLAKKFK